MQNISCRFLREVPKISPLVTSQVAYSSCLSAGDGEWLTGLKLIGSTKCLSPFQSLIDFLNVSFSIKAHFGSVKRSVSQPPDVVVWLLSPVPMKVATGTPQQVGLLHSHQKSAVNCLSFSWKSRLDIPAGDHCLKAQ